MSRPDSPHPSSHPSFRHEWFTPDNLRANITIFAKSLIFFSTATLLLFAALFALTRSIILSQFQSLEAETLHREYSRIQTLLKNEIDTLSATAKNLASLCPIPNRFSSPDSPQPTPKNQFDNISFLQNLSPINFDLFILWGPDSSPLLILPQSNSSLLPSSLPPYSTFLPHNSHSAQGFLSINNTLLLTASQLIPNSTYSLTLIKYFPPPPLKNLLSSPDLPTEFFITNQNLQQNHQLRPLANPLFPFSPQNPTPDASLQFPLPSPDNSSSSYLHVKFPRTIYQAGYSATRIFLLTMAAAGSGLVFVLWLVIYWSVLRPIAILDRSMHTFRNTGLIPASFGLNSSDELGRLARSFLDLTNWLRKLSGLLLRAQDEERRKISRELHDSTAQELSALSLNLSLLQKILEKDSKETSRAKKLVADSLALAEQTARSLRTLAYLLHPPLLDEQGLPFAARWLAEGFANRTNLHTSIHIPDNLPRAAPEIETTIFRFLQEALTNIFKHAKAKNVTIRLWLETSNPSLPTLNAQVTDDGIGFDPSNPTSPTGLGIAGMRERSLINGGSFSIQSSPNQGTKLSLSLPFIPHPSQSQPQ